MEDSILSVLGNDNSYSFQGKKEEGNAKTSQVVANCTLNTR